jgi:Mg2+/Co2+ transporter CorB
VDGIYRKSNNTTPFLSVTASDEGYDQVKEVVIDRQTIGGDGIDWDFNNLFEDFFQNKFQRYHHNYNTNISIIIAVIIMLAILRYLYKKCNENKEREYINNNSVMQMPNYVSSNNSSSIAYFVNKQPIVQIHFFGNPVPDDVPL